MRVLKMIFILFIVFFVACASTQTQEKKEDVEQTEVKGTSDAEKYFSFAYENMKHGDYDKAISNLAKAVKEDSSYLDAYLLLNEAYQAVGDTSSALTMLKERVGTFSDPQSNRKITLTYASLLDKTGEIEKAEQLFSNIIKKHPEDANSYDMYASFLEKKGRNDEALENYKKAYQYDPENPGITFRYGNILFKLEHYKEAKPLLEEAKKTFVDDIEIMEELAECYGELGEYDNAIKEYKSIIERVPKHVASRIGIGNVYIKLKQYQNAERYYKEALAIENENLSIYYGLINLELARKNLSGVKEYIDKGFSIDPNDHILLALYGEYYYRLGLSDMDNKNWRSAKEHFEKAISVWQKTINKTSDSKWIDYSKEGIKRARENIEQVQKVIW